MCTDRQLHYAVRFTCNVHSACHDIHNIHIRWWFFFFLHPFFTHCCAVFNEICHFFAFLLLGISTMQWLFRQRLQFLFQQLKTSGNIILWLCSLFARKFVFGMGNSPPINLTDDDLNHNYAIKFNEKSILVCKRGQRPVAKCREMCNCDNFFRKFSRFDAGFLHVLFTRFYCVDRDQTKHQ